MLSKGKVVRQGTIVDLKKAAADHYEIRLKGDADRFTDVVTAGGATWKWMNDGLIEVSLLNGAGSEELFRAAAQSGVQIRHMARRAPTLEDVFARAMGAE
jgi:ABC-type uncharacterized transport system ATPase subunit